jgi:hypothetical protein
MMNSDIGRLWISRMSFGVAAVALSGLLYGGCQQATERTPEAEPVVAKAPAPQPAGEAAPAPKDVEAIVKPAPEAKKADEKKPEVAPAPEPSPADLAGTLTVKRLSMTSEIKDREPVATESFTLGEGGVLAFVEMSNTAAVDQTILVTFERDEKKVGFVELTVPANQKRWRTWGQTKNIRSAGEWTVVVSTKEGTELSRTTFAVNDAAIPAG